MQSKEFIPLGRHLTVPRHLGRMRKCFVGKTEKGATTQIEE